jgi:tyrosine-protein kinase Etk/Wzc
MTLVSDPQKALSGAPVPVPRGRALAPVYEPQVTYQRREDDDEIDLRSLFLQLLARKWTLLLFALLGALAGGFAGQVPPDQFEGHSVVQIEQKSPGPVLPKEVVGEMLLNDSSESALQTELHIIRSRLTLDPVVEDLDLQVRVEPVLLPLVGQALLRVPEEWSEWVNPYWEEYLPHKFVKAGESVDVEDFSVADALLGKEFELEVLSEVAFLLRGPEGATVEGQVGVPVRLGSDATLLIQAIDAPPGRLFLLVRDPKHVAAARLARRLSVEERRNSEVVDFRYKSGSRELSRTVANAVVSSYRSQNLNRRSAEIDQTISFIEAQLPEVQAKFADAMEELSRFQQEQQPEELSVGTQQVLERAVSLEAALRELEFREQLLLQRLASNHPDVQSLRKGKEKLQAELDQVRLSIATVPSTERELARLTERVERTRELEDQLRNRIEQLRVLKASKVATIRVLDRADAAELVGPNRLLPIPLGGMLAFMVAAASILLSNNLNRSIEDGHAIEQLGLFLFATVNKIKGLAGQRAGSPTYAIALSSPTNPTVEAVRGLRTSLQFSLAGRNSKSLMVTSCAPADGKSFISLNLAIVSARTRGEVLLVDCDLRRGELHRHFKRGRRDAGLSELLAGSAGFRDVLCRDAESGLNFIGSGAIPPNPAELLASEEFEALLEVLEEYYDLVILDAPPVLAVSDPAIIAQTVGLSLLVVRHRKTTTTEVQAAQKILEASGARLAGVALNQFDHKKSRYGAYGARYGYYSGGYSYSYS